MRLLVASGGGARIAFQAGWLMKAVLSRGMTFDAYLGVSAGALVSATLAQAHDDGQLAQRVALLGKVVLGLRGRRDVIRPHLPFGPEWLNAAYCLLTRKRSLFDASPLRALVEKHIDPARLRASPFELRVAYCDYVTGQLFTASQRSDQIVDAVLASAAIPVVFPPVRVFPGSLSCDGGVRDVTPLAAAFQLIREMNPPGTPEMWVLSCNRLSTRPRAEADSLDGLLPIARQAVSILSDEVFRNDIEHAREVNELVKQGQLGGKYRYVEMHVIEPKLALNGGLDFRPAAIRRSFDHGRFVGKQLQEMSA